MLKCYVTDRHRGDIERAALRAIDQGVDFIQIREKDMPARELLTIAKRFQAMAAGTSTRIMVNDRLDVVLACNLDGLHLPGNGLPPQDVRPLVRYLGISTHTLGEVRLAVEAGADFIVFGPVFDTPGKSAVGLDALQSAVAASTVPVLAIGGITPESVDRVAATGAAGFAAIRMFQE